MLKMATTWMTVMMIKMMEGVVTTQHHQKQRHLHRFNKASRNCNTNSTLPAPSPTNDIFVRKYTEEEAKYTYLRQNTERRVDDK